jgi:hypothetical protein
MTPKEKAKELIDKYQFVYIQNYTSMFEVKECALIAIDEIVKKQISGIEFFYYWDQVKYEIEKL